MKTVAFGSLLEDVSTHWTAEMAFPAFLVLAHSVYLLQFVMLGGMCCLSIFAKCWNRRSEEHQSSTTCEVKPAAPATPPVRAQHHRPTHRVSRAHVAVE